MADEEKVVEDKQSAKAGPTYSRARLIEDSEDFLGQPQHIVIGAFAYMKSNKAEMTVADAKKAIDDFLGHEVE